ncbi:MAG: dephospho-CoA kinase [Polyangiaceae bacterium]
MRVFGLTGGIGSGKSTVAKRLRARGLSVVNADELAREAVQAGSPGLARIEEYFGPSVLLESGELHRGRLGEIVFADPEARSALDAIVHPIVRRLAAEHFHTIASTGEPLACYEVPLLYEVGLGEIYRPVVVVTASLERRKGHLAGRDGFNEAQISARIAAQMPLDEKARRAEYVIDNAGSLPELDEAADTVFEALCEFLRVPVARYPKPTL